MGRSDSTTTRNMQSRTRARLTDEAYAAQLGLTNDGYMPAMNQRVNRLVQSDQASKGTGRYPGAAAPGGRPRSGR